MARSRLLCLSGFPATASPAEASCGLDTGTEPPKGRSLAGGWAGKDKEAEGECGEGEDLVGGGRTDEAMRGPGGSWEGTAEHCRTGTILRTEGARRTQGPLLAEGVLQGQEAFQAGGVFSNAEDTEHAL